MSKNYLTEAFKELDLLESQSFDVDKKGTSELEDFLEDDSLDDFEVVIDPEAETEEDLQKSYMGKAILMCDVCHSMIYKDPAEIVIDEESQLANVGELCPYCFTGDGYKVVGKVAPYEEVTVEAEKPVEVKVDGEEVEVEDKIEEEIQQDQKFPVDHKKAPVMEGMGIDSLKPDQEKEIKNIFSSLKKGKNKISKKDLRLLGKNNSSGTGLINQFSDSQLKDLCKKFGYTLMESINGAQKSDLDKFISTIEKDFWDSLENYVLYDENILTVEGLADSFYYEGLQENHPQTFNSIENYYESHKDSIDFWDMLEYIVEKVIADKIDSKELNEEDILSPYFIDILPNTSIKYYLDIEDNREDIPYISGDSNLNIKPSNRYNLTPKELWSSGFKIQLNNINDKPFKSISDMDFSVYDNEKSNEYSIEDIKAGLDDKSILQQTLEEYRELINNSTKNESLKESMDDISITTEDQVIKIKSTPREDKETIQPVTETEVEKAKEAEEDIPVEEEPEEVDVDLDEIDEEGMDDLGESYLKSVYENVNGFKTSKAVLQGNKMILEGVISFTSGNKAKTKFIFESKEATKRGKLKFLGENKNISKNKKAFTLIGSLNNKKLMLESLNYNYTGKDSKTGKTKRLYGTIRRKLK